jgi:hypothetical protein
MYELEFSSTYFRKLEDWTYDIIRLGCVKSPNKVAGRTDKWENGKMGKWENGNGRVGDKIR